MLAIIPNRFVMRKFADLPTGLQNDACVKFIRDFYNEAGDGAVLHILPLLNTGFAIPTIKQHLQQLGGEVRLLGVAWHIEGAYISTLEGGIDRDLRAQIPIFQGLAEWCQGQYMPLQVLLEARGLTVANLQNTPNMTSFAANRVSVVAGSTLPEPQSMNHAVGTTLGKLAIAAVSHKISAVADGACANQYAFLGSQNLADVDIAKALHDKGFITFRRHIGRQGWFLTSDPTLSSDAFGQIVRCRIVDKVARIAYLTYLPKLDSDLIAKNGKIEAITLKSFQQELQRQIEIDCANELNEVSVFVDPSQDVVTLGAISVQISIVPLGYASQINLNLSLKSKIE
jgi:hypothetical protein